MKSIIVLEILKISLLVVTAVAIKSIADKAGISSVVGLLLLGSGVGFIENAVGSGTHSSPDLLVYFGQFGLFALLFKVGLDSDWESLLRYLKTATPIWLGNFVFSGLVGFCAARYLLDISFIPSLATGIALTVTSVGVSVAVWEEKGAFESESGQILLDVAEMDDISGVLAMGLFFAVAPALKEGSSEIGYLLFEVTGLFVVKLGLFGTGCLLFALYIERPLTSHLEKFEKPPDRLISVVGIGLAIAAIAGILGFSLAIGAFFAGLTFSQDSQGVRLDAGFESLYEFFTPFFFIEIGTHLDLTASANWLDAGLLLLGAAVFGKLIGVYLGGAKSLSFNALTVVGISIIPRAEITLVIASKARELGSWALSEQLFSALVFVSMATCAVVPLVLRPIIPPE